MSRLRRLVLVAAMIALVALAAPARAQDAADVAAAKKEGKLVWYTSTPIETGQKIVDLFRTEWHHRGLLIKFKLEVGLTEDELKRVGEASRVASDADYLVANTLDMVTGAQLPASGGWQRGVGGGGGSLVHGVA